MRCIYMASNNKQNHSDIPKVGKADDRSLPAAVRDKIAKGLANITGTKISNALNAIFSKAEITADAVKYIQRGTVYLAEVPKKLQKDFAEGKLKFMKKSTGELVGEIVGSSNFGNKGHVIIKDSGILHSNIPHDLTTIAMQQQLAHMAAVLDEVRSRVIELQNIYDASLLGELRGMRDQLAQVQSVDDLLSKHDLVIRAITSLNSARGRITQRLIDEIQKMPNVPNSIPKSIIKTLFCGNYKCSVESGYGKINELFGYYLAASELLAYAYALIGEANAYINIFTPDCELLNNIGFANLERAECICGISDERWYSAPSKYLGRIRAKAEQIFLSNPDSIVIEITGNQIMGAIEYVEQESEESQVY
jgi:hypothetical protein